VHARIPCSCLCMSDAAGLGNHLLPD
jgi:hypothetical protein